MTVSVSDVEAMDDAAVRGFRERGFIAFDRFIDTDTLETLRTSYDDIIAGKVQAAGDRFLGEIIRQVMVPSRSDKRIADSSVVPAGLDVAQRTFGHDQFELAYDMMIDKPAGTDHETPWHQDIGYFGKPVAPVGMEGSIEDIQFWVALDDVDTSNGCMQFVETPWGSPALEHDVVSGSLDDESRLIALSSAARAEVDALGPVVACPLPAGGATAHFVSTPHYTGQNLTVDRARRAFIFNIGPAGLAAAVDDSKTNLWDE